MRNALGLRAEAALLLLLGWFAVLRGLYLLPATTRPELDLEAGGTFATTLEVYLPAMGITALLLVSLLVGVTAPKIGSAALLAAACMSGAFGTWVLTRDALLDYLPGLGGHLWVGMALSASAALVAGCRVSPARVARDRP